MPRQSGYDDIHRLEITIPKPIKQSGSGEQGIYEQINVEKQTMTVEQFRDLASTKRYETPKHCDHEDLERKYWKNIGKHVPIYGANVSGTLTDHNVPSWNINNLGTILNRLKDRADLTIEGINTPYLYFGMYGTMFPWHTEDMDVYSINYVHFGAPKTWYSIPIAYGQEFEKLINSLFTEKYESCNGHLRHK